MDPIANFLTSIRNGYLAKKDQVVIPSSKVKFALAEILKNYGYVKNVVKSEDGKNLEITLHYLPQGAAVLTGIKRISKPGVRRYAPSHALPKSLSGVGLTVISTSKGMMSDRDARAAHLGGEVICQIW